MYNYIPRFRGSLNSGWRSSNRSYQSGWGWLAGSEVTLFRLTRDSIFGWTWILMICLSLKVVSDYRYSFKSIRIQQRLLDLLQDFQYNSVYWKLHPCQDLILDISLEDVIFSTERLPGGNFKELHSESLTETFHLSTLNTSYPNQKGKVVLAKTKLTQQIKSK